MLRLEDTKQIIGTLDALRRNSNIIVHKKDIRGLRILLHSSDHATGETTGTTDIIVRNNLDAISAQFFRIQSPAIIHHIHVEMICDGIVGTDNLVLD